jgi:hypothetical protein
MDQIRYSVLTLLASSLFYLAGSASQVEASILSAGDIVRVDTDQGAVGFVGGEFSLYKRIGPGESDWEYVTKTFCLEYHAPIETGRDPITDQYYEYVVAAVSDRAISESAPNNPDYLSDEAKFLYYAYQEGILDTFDLGGGVYYEYNSGFWAQSLQNAIWTLEGEDSYDSFDQDLLINLANTEAGNYVTEFDGTVLALNLFLKGTDLSGFDIDDPLTWDENSSIANNHIQDLLWYAPVAAPVPEPATVAIWSLIGFGGLGLMAGRHRRQKSRQTHAT